MRRRADFAEVVIGSPLACLFVFGKEKVDEKGGVEVKERPVDAGLLTETEIAAGLPHGQMDPYTVTAWALASSH